jgi:hypothetical protein
MDFQTMLKKVKQKQYKSKKEFKDDLDLIWSNCFTYNATEVRFSLIHPSLAAMCPILRTTPSAYALCVSNPRQNTSLSISPTGRSALIPPFPSTSLSRRLAVALRLIPRPD